MNDQIAAYLTSLMGALTVCLIGWIGYLTRRLSRLEVHIAESYVAKDDLAGMRSEISVSMGKMQDSIEKIQGLLHELKGSVGGIRQ